MDLPRCFKNHVVYNIQVGLSSFCFDGVHVSLSPLLILYTYLFPLTIELMFNLYNLN